MDVFGGILQSGGDVIRNIEDIEINIDDFETEKVLKMLEKFKTRVNLYMEKCTKIFLKKIQRDNVLDLCSRILYATDYTVKNIFPDIESRSFQFQKLFIEIFFESYNIVYQLTSLEDTDIKLEINSNLSQLKLVLNRINNLSQFQVISESKKRELVLFGGNGAGKSSYIGFLKEFYNTNMVIIPAQKILIYDNNNTDYTKNEEDVNRIQNENFIGQFKKNSYLNINYFSSLFPTLISAIVNKTEFEYNDYHEQKKILQKLNKQSELKKLEENATILDKINSVYEKIIPNIEFKINTLEHSIYPTKEGESYNINSMSDGEKVILYYIGNAILAPKGSYIVVDEPETYLNPGIYSKLWDELELIRSDCQFIYISHDINFIGTRKNADLVWMKKYLHPDGWDFELITDEIKLPQELILEIYGNSNKILFCEGNDDYIIYNILFSQQYKLIQVNGCEQVIRYTKAVNQTTHIHGNVAIGIVDGDNRTKETVKNLEKSKIYTAGFNEIEMLLCDKKIISTVLGTLDFKNRRTKQKKFISEFFNIANKNRKEIVVDILKKQIDAEYHGFNVKNCTVEMIDLELQEFLNKIDCRTKFKKYDNEIRNIIKSKDYDKLLKICNLKKQIIPNLSDEMLIDNYKELAIGVLSSGRLCSEIRNKYFPNIR